MEVGVAFNRKIVYGWGWPGPSPPFPILPSHCRVERVEISFPSPILSLASSFHPLTLSVFTYDSPTRSTLPSLSTSYAPLHPRVSPF